MEAYNDALFESLIPTLQDTHVTVCLENLFTRWQGHVMAGTCSDPHMAVKAIDTYNAMAGRRCFGFYMDTGHLNLIGALFASKLDS